MGTTISLNMLFLLLFGMTGSLFVKGSAVMKAQYLLKVLFSVLESLFKIDYLQNSPSVCYIILLNK